MAAAKDRGSQTVCAIRFERPSLTTNSMIGPRLSAELHHLLIVYTAYVIAAASPGPSNMRIIGVAMHNGRRVALILAAGVVSGSIFCGAMAATGVSALLTRHAEALIDLKIFGGLYLLYLAFKAGKTLLASDAQAVSLAGPNGAALSGAELYRRGARIRHGIRLRQSLVVARC
jgi:threonine efflux protein